MTVKDKLKQLYLQHKEIILYLIFGVLTTFVGWAVYFAVLIPGKLLLGIPVEDTTSARYLALYTAAQILQWVLAVLFAFFTNRKFVFEGAEQGDRVLRQLAGFSGGRVATFFVDYLVTLVGGQGLGWLFPSLSSVMLLAREWNFNEIFAKVLAAVIVIVANYFFSKLLVFRKKKG